MNGLKWSLAVIAQFNGKLKAIVSPFVRVMELVLIEFYWALSTKNVLPSLQIKVSKRSLNLDESTSG